MLNRDVLRQARLLRALHPTDVPVPEVLWEDAGDPPQVPPLFVMSFVAGVSFEPLFHVGRRRRREPGRGKGPQCRPHPGRAACIGTTPGGPGDEPVVGTAEEIDRWCRLLDTVDQTLVAGWKDVAASLHASEPAALPSAIVHGDFRLGNMLAAGSTIVSVVDWEIWSIGDPRVDLGWFLLNADPGVYERPTRYASALPTLEELTAIYAAALGRQPPDAPLVPSHWPASSPTATWSLIVKHNRRRETPDPEIEDIATSLPRLLEQAASLLSRGVV